MFGTQYAALSDEALWEVNRDEFALPGKKRGIQPPLRL
jgi:hypothetical protein